MGKLLRILHVLPNVSASTCEQVLAAVTAQVKRGHEPTVVVLCGQVERGFRDSLAQHSVGVVTLARTGLRGMLIVRDIAARTRADQVHAYGTALRVARLSRRLGRTVVMGVPLE